MARLANIPLLSKRSAALLSLYVGLVGVTLAAWLIMPMVVWVGFIGLTWFHWGQGDAWYLGRPNEGSTLLARGALPMLAPLAFQPEEYLRVGAAFIEASGQSVELAPSPWLLSFPALLVLASVLLLETRRAGKLRLESLMLLAFFAVVPPVLAIAVYFCFWHAPRHLVRLSHELRGPRWRDLAWVLRATIPLTVVASLIALAVFWALPTGDHFSVYLAVIAALTVPHAVVVTWQDARGTASWS